MDNTGRRSPAVLVVDDDEKNVRLVKAILHVEGYQVECARNGEEALSLAKEYPPDLILLDIMMPGINGFEACERLKRDEKTGTIPVIMVTALQEKEHRVRAMDAGADDSITKPIDQTELLIRVKSLLRIKLFHDRLLKMNEEMQHKNKKLKELEAHRDYLTHMIVHDLRNPLNAIIMGIEAILAQDIGKNDQLHQLLQTCRTSSMDLAQMIQNILDIRKMENDQMELKKVIIDPSKIIQETIGQFQLKLQASKVVLGVDVPQYQPPLRADIDILRRVIANLLSNAIRHTPAGGSIQVKVFLDNDEGSLGISIRDSGDGIPQRYHRGIFDKYKQIKAGSNGRRFGGYGLGLVFCRMAIEAHGGRIWVESEGAGKGSSFTFVLPV